MEERDNSRFVNGIGTDLLWKPIVSGLLYFAAGWLGLLVPFTNGNVSPVWPASGVALAAVLMWGYAALPGIALGAFFVNFVHAVPALPAIGIAVGSCVSAITGAYLLKRFAIVLSLPTLRDALGFVAAALIGPIAAASIGVTSLFLLHLSPWSGIATAWRVWWMGDAVGILIITPLFFLYPEFTDIFKSNRHRELLGMAFVLAATSFALFWRTGLGRRDDVLAFVVFPFVLWAAIRFRVIGAALLSSLIIAIAVLGAAQGTGPFVKNNPSHNVILLQVFIAVLSATGLALGAFITERKRTEERLLEQALLLDLANDATIVFGLDDRITFWNRGAEKLYGWTRQEAVGKHIYDVLKSELTQARDEIKTQVLQDGNWAGELVHSTRDGKRITVSSRWSLWRTKQGKPLGFLQLNTDITERKQAVEDLQALSGRLLKVQDDERRRIARELHDSLGQYLTAVKIELDLLVRSNNPITADNLREPLRFVEEAISETRTISHLLHPPLLDEAGFASAARWYVEGFAKRSGIKATLTIPGQLPRLAQNVETALFRILQESLVNVHRHSGTASVDIQLAIDNCDLVLTIKDYGHGIPTHVLQRFDKAGTDTGVGLAGIRERVKELGGSLSLESGTQGTVMSVTVPIFPTANTAHVAPFQKGDHICLFYRDVEEQIATAGPFVLLGLVQNERCLCVLSQTKADRLLAWLERTGIDCKKEISRGALIITSPESAYLAGGGFSKEKMVKLLDDGMQEAIALGFSGFRGTGDLSWAANVSACWEHLVEYELMLDRYYPGKTALGICMYDASLFSEDKLKEMMQAHHYVLTNSNGSKTSLRIRKGQLLGDVMFDGKVPSRFEYMVQRDDSAEVLRVGEENTLRNAIDAVESAMHSEKVEQKKNTEDESDSRWMASASD